MNVTGHVIQFLVGMSPGRRRVVLQLWENQPRIFLFICRDPYARN